MTTRLLHRVGKEEWWQDSDLEITDPVAPDSLDWPEHFQIHGEDAVYRPAGKVSGFQAFELIKAALALARARGIRRLLVVTSGLTGFAPPNSTDRYLMVKEWAAAAGVSVCVALVAPPEMIDSEGFGALVAANFGFRYKVFLNEDLALSWLERVSADAERPRTGSPV